MNTLKIILNFLASSTTILPFIYIQQLRVCIHTRAISILLMWHCSRKVFQTLIAYANSVKMQLRCGWASDIFLNPRMDWVPLPIIWAGNQLRKNYRVLELSVYLSPAVINSPYYFRNLHYVIICFKGKSL